MRVKASFVNTLGPGLNKLAKKYPKIVRDGVAHGAMALIEDAGEIKYKPPIESGDLRGSWFVSVEGKVFQSGPESQPVAMPKRSGAISADVGFTQDYAAAQHENLWPVGPWQPNLKHADDNPQIGGKFLERKMDDNANEYASIIVNYIRSQLGT